MTNTSVSNEVVLRTDTKGRVQTPPERRQKLLEEFERSGLSGAKFAALVGVRYSTFAGWVARWRKTRAVGQGPVKGVDSIRWVEAVVSEAAAPASASVGPVKLRLPTGAWIEVSDLNQVSLAAALTQALEKSPAPC
jgi:hypothetical protein